MNEEKPKFTKAQEVFVNEYLKCFNGTEAYSRAYPKSSRDAARANAARLIATDSIKAEIDRRLAEVHMSADEALKLMADIARGDITEFITPLGNLDIDLLKKNGKGRLVKKIKQKTVTKIGKGESDEDTEVLDTEIELYPADAALRDVLKIHGKYKEQVDITSNGEKIQTIDDERFNRAITTLADALGEIIPGAGVKQNSKVDPPK